VVRMTVTVKVIPEKRMEFLQALDPLKETEKRRSSFCSNFVIFADAHDPNLFNISFEWGEDPHFENYLDSEEFRLFLGAVRVLCEEASFLCNSCSEKWTRLIGMHRDSICTQSEN